MVGSSTGFRIFGQVINRVGHIADLVINRVRVLGSGSHTPTQFFWEYPPEFCKATM